MTASALIAVDWGSSSFRAYLIARGEEVEIVGLAEAGDRVVVRPGSHSKWAVVEAGRVARFKTFVTGELHAAVRDHTLIGAFARAAPPQPLQPSFARAVRRGGSFPTASRRSPGPRRWWRATGRRSKRSDKPPAPPRPERPRTACGGSRGTPRSSDDPVRFAGAARATERGDQPPFDAHTPNSRSAFPCAIVSRSAGLTGRLSRKARDSAIGR